MVRRLIASKIEMAEAVCDNVFGFWWSDGSASSHDGIHARPLL